MWHIVCSDIKAGNQEELHFKKLVHSQIDRNSPRTSPRSHTSRVMNAQVCFDHMSGRAVAARPPRGRAVRRRY